MNMKDWPVRIPNEYRQGDFAAIPGCPWVYWITPGVRNLFLSLPNLGTISKPCVGINTNKNVRRPSGANISMHRRIIAA